MQSLSAQEPMGTVWVRYGDGSSKSFRPVAESRASRGDALAAAAASLNDVASPGFPGPEVFLDGNCDYEAANLSFADDGVQIHGRNARVYRKPGVSYNEIVRVEGSQSLVENLNIDGGYTTQGDTGTDNTGFGRGLVVNNGTGITVRSVQVSNTRGVTVGTTANGSANGIEVGIAAHDTSLKDIAVVNAGYAGVRNGGYRTTMDGFLLLNNMSRGWSADNTQAVDDDFFIMKNGRGIVNVPVANELTGAGPGGNFNKKNGVIKHVVMENVHLYQDPNLFGAGNSFNTNAGMNTAKFENIDKLEVDNCTFIHGDNAYGGSAFVTSIRFEPTGQMNHASFRNTYFSSGIAWGGTQWPFMEFENCDIGADFCTVNSLIFTFHCNHASFRSTRFRNIPRYCFTVSGSRAADDFLEFSGCQFYGAQADSTVLSSNIALSPGRTIFGEDNLFSSCRRADTADLRLLTTTQARNWETLLFRESLMGTDHPTPGLGPYFPSLPGKEGMRIINQEYSPDATTLVPEREWVYRSGAWKEVA